MASSASGNPADLPVRESFMAFITAAGMRSLEDTAFQRGISAETLMDLAGRGIAQQLIEHFPHPGRAVAYVGKGNNGGDALIALRELRSAGWQIGLRSAYPEPEWSDLSRNARQQLGPVPSSIPHGPGTLLLLDGLLGIGARGPMRPPLAALALEMETLRRHHGAIIAAMDLPSGMDADTGEGDAVTSDLTLTVAVPKRGLATASGEVKAGRVLLVPLADLPPPHDGSPDLFSPAHFSHLLPPRPHDFHKGRAGRVGILAGSPGMTGAAVLTASAALRAGAGLITLHVERDFLPALSASIPPEIMVAASAEPVEEAFEAGHDALVIGPGTGHSSETWRISLLSRLSETRPPTVLDADALNLLAASGQLALLRETDLLTPHPGEFRRLAPDLAALDRWSAIEAFLARHPCTLLLKGARSISAHAGIPPRWNPTGHAGMASGGQGDVLAGVAGALLAQGLSTLDASSLAAWLCGRAAERSLETGPVTTAGDTLAQLGGAMRDWRERRR